METVLLHWLFSIRIRKISSMWNLSSIEYNDTTTTLSKCPRIFYTTMLIESFILFGIKIFSRIVNSDIFSIDFGNIEILPIEDNHSDRFFVCLFVDDRFIWSHVVVQSNSNSMWCTRLFRWENLFERRWLRRFVLHSIEDLTHRFSLQMHYVFSFVVWNMKMNVKMLDYKCSIQKLLKMISYLFSFIWIPNQMERLSIMHWSTEESSWAEAKEMFFLDYWLI